MLEGKPVVIFNGQMVRDFTYIDDIIESLMRLLEKPATTSPADPQAPTLPPAGRPPGVQHW